MKKIIIIVTITICIFLSVFSIASCELNRKLDGAEIQFAKTVSESNSFSFDMVLLNEKDEKIEISCAKRNQDYAYSYKLGTKTYPTYRQLYIDSKLYSFLEAYDNFDFNFGDIPLGVGAYYVENKPYNVPENILYSVCENILEASYVTLITKAVVEKDDFGIKLYKYDITYENVNYLVWFDDTVLRRIKMTYQDGSFYDVSFSSYRFGTIDETLLLTPDESTVAYVQSRFSFEEWAMMLDNFATKIDGCLPKDN